MHRTRSQVAEACYTPGCKTFGIAWEDRPIGLLTLVDSRQASPEDADDFQPGCALLWRMMIDHRFQGRGFGSEALLLVMNQARADGLRGLSLGVADGKPGNALAFYRKHGFEPTGRRDDDEIELCRWFETPPESERDERSL